jgi:hypothetical protein
VLKETDRETKHIIETLVAFENGIDRNRSALDKECSHIENEIALEKSKAIGRLNELENQLVPSVMFPCSSQGSQLVFLSIAYNIYIDILTFCLKDLTKEENVDI